MAARRFPSKIDKWLVFVMLAVLLVPLGVLVTIVRADAPALAVTAALVVTVAVYLFVGLTLSRTYYVVEKRRLRIVCGIFYWSIPLADIESVERTRSPFSSPALSLDRLRIRYGGGKRILVSPADQPRFLKALQVDDGGRRA